MEQRKRYEYLDRLRIIACFGVVLNHVCGTINHSVAAESLSWQMMNVFNGLTRWTPPVFVMISGAVVLGRAYPKEKIKRAVIRFLLLYLLWNTVYAGMSFLNGDRLKDVFSYFVVGHWQMWYLPMIAWLYLLIPLFDYLLKNEKLARYFISLAMIGAVCIPTGIAIAGQVNTFVGKTLEQAYTNAGFQYVSGLSCYFLLGYLLRDVEISARKAKWIYAAGIAGAVVTIVVSSIISSGFDQPQWIFSNLSVNVFVTSAALFIWAKKSLSSKSLTGFETELAKNSFGVYLIHMVFVDIIVRRMDLSRFGSWTIVAIPMAAIVIFVASNLVVSAIRRIPIVKNIVQL